MRLNLLQHLTGENFHKTHNFYVLFVMISPLKLKRDNFGCYGTLWTIDRKFIGEEEKKDKGLRIDERRTARKIRLNLLQHLTGASSVN